ncbi:MAG: ketosteroid isomerase family protein [Rhodococcus sp. (in: high G+C Gram-positive bacteria)]
MPDPTPTGVELLAAVSRSPAAVAAHDRAAWVGLFSDDARVNDPVGSRPHVGTAAIGRFYDTFIAPNAITFHARRDVVCGMSVVRDLDLETRMSTGVVLTVPMHLRYDLVAGPAGVAVGGLYAHWELPGMIAQLTRAGWRGAVASVRLGPQLLSNQGLSGVTGFMRGLRTVGRPGRNAAIGFLVAVRRRDTAAMSERLAHDASLELSDGTAMPLDHFAESLRELQWNKMIVAGRTVTASVRAAAWEGVALLEFASRSNEISRVRMFVERAGPFTK